MMRVAIVRGPSLNSWEMQSYESLRDKVELVGIGSKIGHYDISQISFKIKKPHCLGEYLNYVPGGINWLYKHYGDTQKLIGIDKLIRGFDIVHVAELASYYSLQAVEAKDKGLIRAVTVSVYENIPFKDRENLKRQANKQKVIENADWFMAMSEGARNALVLEGVKANKISVIGQGVDRERFFPISNPKLRQSLRRKYGFKAGDFIVLFVGRLVKEKGVYDVLRGAQILINSNKNISNRQIQFMIVGKGSEELKLKKKTVEYNISDKVKFIGPVKYQNMPEIYQLADVFVLASKPTKIWKEQFGNVLIEAMASGLPVIGTDCGAIPEVVPKKGGLFFKPGDVASLKENIFFLYNNVKKKNMMGKLNRKTAIGKYDARLVANKMLVIWEKLLK